MVSWAPRVAVSLLKAVAAVDEFGIVVLAVWFGALDTWTLVTRGLLDSWRVYRQGLHHTAGPTH